MSDINKLATLARIEEKIQEVQDEIEELNIRVTELEELKYMIENDNQSAYDHSDGWAIVDNVSEQ